MAKLDKAPAYEAGDCRFESCSERQSRLGALSQSRRTNGETAGGEQQSNGEVAERLKALPC